MVIKPSLRHILLLKLLLGIASGEKDGNGMNDADADAEGRDREHKGSTFQCSIYLAPSSIPNSGMGVYTTRDIEEGEEILPYADSPSIVGCDEETHETEEDTYTYGNADYVWSSYGQAKFECDILSEAVMNIGSMCNYHTFLSNTNPVRLAPYDDSILDRFKDPGAGAISYMGGHIFGASQKIRAGEELFCDYGAEWLDGREGTFADFIPRHKDFEVASSLFQIMKEELRNVEISDTLLKTMKEAIAATNPRVSAALPGTKESYDYVLQNSKLSTPSSAKRYSKALADRTVKKRDVKWIEENGFCLEKIKPGLSTIEGAGRGGFAQGTISAGEIISLVPLIIFSDKESMNMYNLTRNEETGKLEMGEHSQLIGKQLLTNYCFGSKFVQFLLCPLTSVILINHQSNRNGGKGPNARIEWDFEYDHTQQFLDLSLEELLHTSSNKVRGMTFRVVAARTMSPGEEVTIDYGPNWEKAWNDHVQGFEPPVDNGTYIPIRSMIDTKDFRTIEELKRHPYPENVELICFFDEDDEWDDDDKEESEEIPLREVDGVSIYDGSVHVFSEEGDVGTDIEYFRPCQIIRKNEDSLYEVQFLDSYRHYANYPESSLSFRIVKYKSDTHLSGAFRHYIELPDEMIPSHWRNNSEENE